ncbi:hypothetical protein HNQ59_001080 [Chitinivorax tropicus]|uniref:Uncharacterized protein n=1 Tax=Chitinivorax tropicus TaxID=714531 RepID=A0A840MHE9_9PROT|nr:hypothetical protein [Chitinivorax tropicus]MBB5017810.1 hypothetical protein [Chitinivorax tropicus]
MRKDERQQYDAWFREQVARGLVEADAPATVWVTQEEAKASWAERRAKLLARIEVESRSSSGGGC